jgi:phosphatidylglycerol:prolipoprotein diacylglycerol transferase
VQASRGAQLVKDAVRTMIPYPDIDPVLVRIGPIAVRWYGLMYLLGFGASFILVRARLRSESKPVIVTINPDRFLEALYTYLVIGLMVGARLGYVLFYDLVTYIQHPLSAFAVWNGGMSFHGGLVGAVAAGVLCCRKYEVDIWKVADLVISTAPIGLGLGRIGNFINGELYGRITDAPWGMVFPGGGPLPRHPSQLYEFLLEGVVLFLVLAWLGRCFRRSAGITGAFLVLYGSFRIIAEVFRQPDPQLGFLLGPVTMGQLLSSFMVLAGMILLLLRKRVRPA